MYCHLFIVFAVSKVSLPRIKRLRPLPMDIIARFNQKTFRFFADLNLFFKKNAYNINNVLASNFATDDGKSFNHRKIQTNYIICFHLHLFVQLFLFNQRSHWWEWYSDCKVIPFNIHVSVFVNNWFGIFSRKFSEWKTNWGWKKYRMLWIFHLRRLPKMIIFRHVLMFAYFYVVFVFCCFFFAQKCWGCFCSPPRLSQMHAAHAVHIGIYALSFQLSSKHIFRTNQISKTTKNVMKNWKAITIFNLLTVSIYI